MIEKSPRILSFDPKTKRIFDFITSDFRSSAQKTADIYQAPWSVEFLFRWLKEHLLLREPPYRNRNAIATHMAISLLIRLLVELFRRRNKLELTAAETLRLIMASLWHQGRTKSRSPPSKPRPKA